jgi:hypothetical protein
MLLGAGQRLLMREKSVAILEALGVSIKRGDWEQRLLALEPGPPDEYGPWASFAPPSPAGLF